MQLVGNISTCEMSCNRAMPDAVHFDWRNIFMHVCSNERRLNQSKQLFNFTMLRCNLPAVRSIQLMHHHFQIFFRKNSFENQLQKMRHCWANNTDLSLFIQTLTLWFGSITQNLYRALFGSIHNTKTKFERISCRYKFYEYSNSLRNTRPTNAREREGVSHIVFGCKMCISTCKRNYK